MQLMRSILSLLLATAGGSSALAQVPACNQPTALASVLDAQGLPVAGLKPADFDIQVNGKPSKILNMTEDRSPRRIVVLLDASKGMRGENNGKWVLALQIAIDVFVKIPQETQLALLIYSNQVEKTVGFSQDRSAALALLGNLRSGVEDLDSAGRGPHFLDAILQALSLFGESQFGDTIFAITSGFDTGSKASLASVEHSLLQTPTRTFLSALISWPGPLSGIGIYREALPASVAPPPGQRALAVPGWVKSTGGSLLTVHSVLNGLSHSYEFDEDQKRNLAASLAAFYRQMLETYRFDLDLPAKPEKSIHLKVQLSRSVAPSHKDWVILYPSSVVACHSGHS